MAATLPGTVLETADGGVAACRMLSNWPRWVPCCACTGRSTAVSFPAGRRPVARESRAGVDSDGLRESLAFFDESGRCCWRLFLLPDSDFLAWDRLLACLPMREEVEPTTGVGERLWRKLAGRLLGEQWQACVLKLHVLPSTARRPVLAASLGTLSPLGANTARRIAEAEGAEENAVFDDCCCARRRAMAHNTQARFAARRGRSSIDQVQSQGKNMKNLLAIACRAVGCFCLQAWPAAQEARQPSARPPVHSRHAGRVHRRFRVRRNRAAAAGLRTRGGDAQRWQRDGHRGRRHADQDRPAAHPGR